MHYTGWNTRYDEWVPKERIAENLTNNKTNKRAKTGGSSSGNSNFSKTSDCKSGGLDNKLFGSTSSSGGGGSINSAAAHPSKILFKRGRGSSRGESQPPRSTTPSSVASNSSRTKSPATPAQRRTTRGQPSSIRRTSNNTDISSIQTDTDTDSDEPVKKPPCRKIPLPRSSQPSTSTSTASGTKTNSNPSSEEESIGHSSNVKGRDYDLIQIRSELKGFKELKSPSPDLYNESNEKKFEFPSSTASNTESGDSISQDITKVVTSDSKTSSDTSSESDSYGDDDSQFSDKATTLENLSEKLQEKFKAGKLDTDVFKKVTSLGATIPPAVVVPPQSVGSIHTDLVDKVATLKASGIEQIIKNSLAEKPKAPAEKMTMKALCERSPLKQMEKEKLREKETTIPEKKSPKIDRTSRLEKVVPIAVVDKVLTTKSAADSVLSDPDSDEPLSPIQPKFSVPLAPIVSTSDNIKNIDKCESKMIASTASTSSSSLSAAGDIYEFKEPEPFEFETVKKLSPDIEKKPKKKPFTESMDPKAAVLPIASPSLMTKKAKKSPAKEEKPTLQIDYKMDSLDNIRSSEEHSPSVLTPQKAESIFDSLRKSPSFNLKLQAHQNHLDDLQVLSTTSSSLSLLVKDEISEQIATTSKPTFISSFVEATPEETLKIFDPKSGLLDTSDDEKPELETAKKILLSEDVYEPPKIDKPSSIADKLLKALNQQQHQMQMAKPDETKTTDSEQVPPVSQTTDCLKLEVKLEAESSPQVMSEPLQMDLPAIIKKDIETPPKKPVLSSPEHKLDILESIAPKNNDLSETIQKLESVIQQTVDMGNMSDDSSDSTDSEQRLIIEDESLSSETQNDFSVVHTIASPSKMIPKLLNDSDIASCNLKADTEPPTKLEFDSQSDDDVPTTAALGSPPIQPLSQIFGSKYSFGEPPKIVDKPTTTFSIIEPLAARPQKLPSPPGQLAVPQLIVPPTVSAEFSFKYSSTSLFDANHDAESNIPISTIKREESLVISQSTTNAEAAASKESLSLLLCEETIPGSPTPLCPREICGDGNINLSDNVGSKKGYEIMFVSPHPTTSDIKSVPMDIETIMVTSTSNVTIEPAVVVDVKQKIEPLSPQSSARDSLSHDDSSEDIRKHGKACSTQFFLYLYTFSSALEGDISLRKRRRSKKLSECEGSTILKRRKGTSRRNTTTGKK